MSTRPEATNLLATLRGRGARASARRREAEVGGGLPLRWALLGIAALTGSLLAGLAIGPASLSVSAIVADVASRLPGLHLGERLNPLDEAVLWQIRAPRVVLGAIVGGTLASAGAGYQAVFRNPLAEPYMLGVAAGAGLGATAEIVYGPPGARSLLIVMAFAGALAAVAVAYALGRSLSGRDVSTLILAGIAVLVLADIVSRTALRRPRARCLAYVPQSPQLPAEMSVWEYASLGRTPHLGYLGRGGKQDAHAVESALLRLDLSAMAHRRLATLSGGERQRVGSPAGHGLVVTPRPPLSDS